MEYEREYFQALARLKTDEEIDQTILEDTEAVARLETDLENLQVSLECLHEERKARVIEKYYQAHPDLIRVVYADVLAVTPEFLEGQYATNGQRAWEVITEAFVSGAYVIEDKVMIGIHHKNAHAAVPAAVASRMRQAYLEAHHHDRH